MIRRGFCKKQDCIFDALVPGGMCMFHGGDGDKYKTIESLKKENAELKSKLDSEYQKHRAYELKMEKEIIELKSKLDEAVDHLGYMLSFTRDPKWQNRMYVPDCNDTYHSKKREACEFVNKIRTTEVKK